ncbi:type II and III secretion system protein family protein [Aurantiacibacter sp. MUD11]|uniref:type II and III secretion system protein family protein n=1 Tax=Aurantiacibacter sp. MUD11 TaxID=3003265 RepID=UPI0022AA7E92|nr:type II and III secretion system protein family protein [Aurantiacibacter sp. MUD11]WAT16713.1 type II and III secretion system protein family protein [Aurantiacibacter sp. MUD11]
MKMLNACALALATVSPLAIAMPALAQETASATSLHAGTLEVPVNKSMVVSADTPIARAMIGNAEIADVLPISDRSIYVLGREFGTTSLTLYDARENVIAVMDVSVGPDVVGLRGQLAELLPGEDISVRLSNGRVLLTGMVSDPGPASRAAQLAEAYAGDNVINLLSMGGSQQVMLEVRFAEVDRTVGERLGVSGIGLSDDGDFSGVLGSGVTLPAGTLDEPGLLTTNPINDAFGILSQTFSLGSLDIDATLDMLERRGLSRTLAEPTLVALSGEPAYFLAGGEFPIPVVANFGLGQTSQQNLGVEFKSFGVSLSFTPTVLGRDVISLVVEPEVSSIDESTTVSVNGITIPGLQTRRARTTVELRDGESFAIAGLLREEFRTTVRQVPLLGSLPIIGTLFRSTSFQQGQTELLIVITPRLVAPIRPEQVRLPTDRLDPPQPYDVLLDGEGYRPRALDPIEGETSEEETDYEY